MLKNIIHRTRDFIINHDLFFKLFCALMACIIIPVIIACVSSYIQTEDLVKEQTTRSTASYLSSLAARMETVLTTQKIQMMDYSLKEPLTNSFASEKTADESLRLLQNATNTNDYLKAVFVYDSETSIVVSDVGKFDAKIYFGKYCYFSQLTFDELGSLLSENRGFNTLGALDYRNLSKRHITDPQRTLVLLYSYYGERPYNSIRTIGFVLSSRIVGDLVESNDISRQGEVCITDHRGACLFSSSEKLGVLLDTDPLALSHNKEINGQPYVIHQSSSASGYLFTNVISEDEYYANLRHVRTIFSFLVIILLLLTVLIALTFSNRFSGPLIMLADSFSHNPREKQVISAFENTSVFRKIYSNLDQLRISNETMSNWMKTGQRYLRSTALMELLQKRHRDSAFLSNQFSELQEQFCHPYYTFFLVSFEFYKRAYLDYTPDELLQMQEGLCKLIVSREYPFRMKIEYVECDPQNYGFIINIETDDLSSLHHELEKLLALVAQGDEPLRLIFVLTETADNIKELPELYQTAKRTLRYRILNLQHQILCSNQLPLGENIVMLLTEENKSTIIKYLLSSNSVAVSNYICELIDRCAEQIIPYEYLNTSFATLLTLFAQVLSNYGIALFELFDTDPFSELNALNNLDEIKDFFHIVCVQTTEALANRQQRETAILQRALDYIEENYSNHISLDDVSTYVGYSSKYFSRYFKEQIGNTFVNYLNQLRIRRAKTLLNDKTITIKDIATAVGFESANTFIRVFKQFEGVPPGQYRQTCKPETLQYTNGNFQTPE